MWLYSTKCFATRLGYICDIHYIVADVQLHIPDEMGFEDAASLGVTV